MKIYRDLILNVSLLVATVVGWRSTLLGFPYFFASFCWRNAAVFGRLSFQRQTFTSQLFRFWKGYPSPLKIDGWKMTFYFWVPAYFWGGYVTFRECITKVSIIRISWYHPHVKWGKHPDVQQGCDHLMFNELSDASRGMKLALIPSWELNISHLGKRKKSSSKLPFQGICSFAGGYSIVSLASLVKSNKEKKRDFDLGVS